ncbi:ran-binding protein 3-like isoform X2 [Galleria mellonella]|uniref:Ran-binding protein 3-like isoform X2 n=1 Tax=Galleria mellonella TaxID=7137 RepID=A0A6J1WD74_GALME|nr:ran-binding protein 3-like isoform X2 [Galleria mellonella]
MLHHQRKPSSEDFYNGSSVGQSRVVLAKPRLGGFGSSSFASSSSKSCNPFGSVLRPPQLKPSSNPFLKVTEASNESEVKKETETPTDEEKLNETKKETDVPMFVPLGSANVTSRTANTVPAPAPAQPASSSSGFVFGQNLSERVVINESLNNGEASSTDHGTTNGTTELLFTSAAASVKENAQDEAGPSDGAGSGSSLAAAAAEYERSHAPPPPPTTNYTTTGEEGEINVLQISCRLFAWESGSWRERGRGVLRLNDPAGGVGAGAGPGGAAAAAAGAGAGAGAARLVARVAGSLRVVLNTKLWPDMVVERAGTKSLRITAADAQQQVKLFLIMGAPVDIAQLHRALTSRIAVSKRTINCTQNTTSQKAAERLEAATDEIEYLDKANDDAFSNDDETNYENKPSGSKNTASQSKSVDSQRLEVDPEEKTDKHKTNLDGTDEENETKSLKRKEPAEDEKSPKRQCPDIVVE